MSRYQANQPPPNVAELINKLYDADSDIRYMSLSDLQIYFNSQVYGTQLTGDHNTCAKLVDGFIHTLNDPNGEVQNQTINCIGPFVNKMSPTTLAPMIHRITDLEKSDNVDKSMSAQAVRAIVISLPRPSPGAARSKPVVEAYSAISKVLIPRLIGYLVYPHGDKSRPEPPKGMLEEDLENGEDSNALDVLTEVARCFGPMLQEEEIAALQKITLQFIESKRIGSVMKKKAVIAISALSHYFSNAMLSSFVSHIIEAMRNSHLTPTNRRLYITVLGSFARVIPAKFGPHLRTLAPFVLAAVSQQELDEQAQAMEEDVERDPQIDEVREAALVALETFLTHCGVEMERYLEDTVEASLRFIKYDPVVANEDDDEADDIADVVDEDDEFELDEDFEQEGGVDDEDDVSWKVRRHAAKTLNTIISLRGRDLLENANVYDRIASALISRFKEREESVRLEVLATLAFLIRRTGEEERGVDLHSTNTTDQITQPQTRKRRRGNSDVTMTDVRKFRRLTGSTSPETFIPPRIGPLACLAKVSDDLVDGLLKLLKNSPAPTKQASISVFKDIVTVQQGSLDVVMDNLLDQIIAAVKMPNSGIRVGVATHVSGSSDTGLQIEALQLLSEILKAHSSKTFQSQLPKLTATVTQATQDRSSRLACEALSTLEQLVKALTPPRSASTGQKTAALVEQMRETVTNIISARNADLAVRQQAISVLATILGRTLSPQGTKLLSEQHRAESFEMLYETCRNETTRYATIKAINALALQATDNKKGFETQWLSKVGLELGAQLRKADRSLRGASLEALKTLISERDGAQKLDKQSVQQFVALLQPLISTGDLHLIGPTLLILAAMVRSADVLTLELNKAICDLVSSSSASPVSEQLCILARAIGERGVGAPVMQALLKDVGIDGNPSVVGKVIGTLLVFGNGTVGVTLDDFLMELQQSQSKRPPDNRRSCLALSVLGEAGARLGTSASPLSLQLFTKYFSTKSDEVQLAAASALGRAAAGPGNVKSWASGILNEAKQNSSQLYLLLIAIREVLRHNENDKDILPFTGSLWDLATSAARTESNRTIGAECVANLVMVDPVKFLPALQSLSSDQTAAVRGVAILAFRDVFTVTDSSYDKDLRPVIVEVLTTMMRDADVENRRQSLNTFNAAARNKPDLLLPHLNTLMPLVLDQSVKDPSLMREVSMGPFKHMVDDGLELRKSAYETLYSLMEITPTRIDIVKLYDRVVAGIDDDRGVQALCNLMLSKLMISGPDETSQRLEAMSEQFKKVLNVVLKDTAVRPEIEKAEEARKGVVKISLELEKALPNGVAQSGAQEGVSRPAWEQYLGFLREKFMPLLKEIERKQ